MIKINESEIKNVFCKIFPTENKNNIKTFKYCAPLKIMGISKEYSGSFFLPLSIATYCTINVTNNGIFKIAEYNSDIIYQRKIDTLLIGTDNSEINTLFPLISQFKGNITGADILFTYSVDTIEFINHKISCIASFYFLNNNSFPQTESVKNLNLTQSHDIGFADSLMYAKRDKILYSFENQISYFDDVITNGNKLIIFTANNKNTNKMKHAFNQIITTVNTSELSNSGTLSFIQNENRRNQQLLNILSDYSESKFLINEIAENRITDFLSEYPSDAFKSLYTIIKTSFPSVTILLAVEYGGLCAIVSDNEVDHFADVISKRYEFEQGYPPIIYITQSKNSYTKTGM